MTTLITETGDYIDHVEDLPKINGKEIMYLNLPDRVTDDDLRKEIENHPGEYEGKILIVRYLPLEEESTLPSIANLLLILVTVPTLCLVTLVLLPFFLVGALFSTGYAAFRQTAKKE
jgi:hypothetical protein